MPDKSNVLADDDPTNLPECLSLEDDNNDDEEDADEHEIYKRLYESPEALSYIAGWISFVLKDEEREEEAMPLLVTKDNVPPLSWIELQEKLNLRVPSSERLKQVEFLSSQFDQFHKNGKLKHGHQILSRTKEHLYSQSELLFPGGITFQVIDKFVNCKFFGRMRSININSRCNQSQRDYKQLGQHKN